MVAPKGNESETGNKGGRPSSYKPEYAEQAQKLCEFGLTDEEIARFFDVHTATIYRWQAKYPEFCEALKVGKAPADDRVERSLYHKATGYTFNSEKVFNYQGEIVRTPVVEHVPPDTTAAIFWLKNRRKDIWRDKQDHEHTGKDGEKLIPEESADSRSLARAVLGLLREANVSGESEGEQG